jgi:hypothetical protein
LASDLKNEITLAAIRFSLFRLVRGISPWRSSRFLWLF